MPRADVSKCSNILVQRPALLNHLVGAGEQRGRHFEAERIRDLEIDRQLELGRCLDREIGWLGAAKNAIDVFRSAGERLAQIDAIRNQAAFARHESERIYGREPVASGERKNHAPMHVGKVVRRHDQAAARLARKHSHCRLDLLHFVDDSSALARTPKAGAAASNGPR